MNHSKKDPLDQKIDDLLAGQPVKVPTDFATRTLVRAEADTPREKPDALAPLLRFALPLAAAIALAFILFHAFSSDKAATPAQISDKGSITNEALTSYEVQELLLLQEGLSGFAQIETDEIKTGGSLATLDTLQSI